jgi:hypothetical protein
LALAKMAAITLSDTPPVWLGNPISDSLERMLHIAPSVIYPPPEPEFPPILQVLTALIPLWRAGLTSWDKLLRQPRPALAQGALQPPELLTAEAVLRLHPDIGPCPGLPGAMRYLSALLTSTTLAEFTHFRTLKQSTAMQPSLRLAERWVQGLELHALPGPAAAAAPP